MMSLPLHLDSSRPKDSSSKVSGSHSREAETSWLKYQHEWPRLWPGRHPRLPIWPSRLPQCLLLPDNSLPPPPTANPRPHSVKSHQSWRKESLVLHPLQTWKRLVVSSPSETVLPVCTVLRTSRQRKWLSSALVRRLLHQHCQAPS